MMKSVEKVGRTVEEAVEAALEELGISRDQAEVRILEEPNKGFLGLVGTRQARVIVAPKEDGVTKARYLLEDILEELRLGATVEVTVGPDVIRFDVIGQDLGLLIGRRGQTLDALQYLVNLVARMSERKSEKTGDQRTMIVVDAQGYRGRREQSLMKLALRTAEMVRREGKEARLEPMTPAERRIIHTALHDDAHVCSHSEGEDPYRRVVISPRE